MDLRKYTRANRYEKILGGRKGGDPGRSFLAGASRATRLSYHAKTPEERVFWDTGSNVVAPLVFFYAKWLLEQARKRNIRRLYFFSRDGAIIKHAADILKKKHRYEVDLRYLYGSRETWLPAALERIDSFEWAWLSTSPVETVSINEIIKRAGIRKEGILDKLNEYGLAGVDPRKNLYGEQRESLRRCFMDRQVSDRIKHALEENYRLAKDYLIQEGMADPERFAFVDSGWVARSQYAISSILERAGLYPCSGIDGFYIGLTDKKWIFGKDRLHSFMFDWGETPADPRICFYMVWETLLTTGHGRVIGYRSEGGKIVPVFEKDHKKTERSIYAGLHYKSVSRFTSMLAKNIHPKHCLSYDPARISWKTVRTFIDTPSKQEARVYGEVSAASEITGRDIQKLAPEIKYKDIPDIIKGKRKDFGFWPTGTLERSGMLFAGVIWKISMMFCYGIMRKVFVKSE